MRRALAVLLAVLVLANELPAQSKHDWNNVQKLKPRISLQVLLWSGETLTGRLITASNSGLRLAPADAIGTPRDLARSTVRKVIRTRQHKLPDPEKWMIIGAVAGGAIGTTSGAISDAAHHENNARWFTGGLAGAALGFFASCAALATVGAVELFHHNTVVYEDTGTRPPSSPAS
jgi:hypothetical protein